MLVANVRVHVMQGRLVANARVHTMPGAGRKEPAKAKDMTQMMMMMMMLIVAVHMG